MAMIEAPRVLGVIRLSVTRDDTTSPEKQRESIRYWANGPDVNGRIVDWAEDLDVSGGLDPFKRPALGPWLTERYEEFDVIAVWKIDRLTRRSAHFSEMFAWCEKHGKRIVSMTEKFDMTDPMGKMFAQIIAAFAEGELDTIRARAESGALTRLRKGVWVGGVEPFGYRFHRQENGGKKLVQDPQYAAVLHEIVDRIRNDWSMYKIARDFNERGVLTWRDHLREEKLRESGEGRGAQGLKWTTSTVLAVLRNETVGGLYTYKGQIVEDDEGNAVQITDEPIMPYGEWSVLVAGIAANRTSLRDTPSRTMLGGVALCGMCGGAMSSAKKAHGGARVYHYYTCNGIQTGACPDPARVRRDDLDYHVNKFMAVVIGRLPVVERVASPLGAIRLELEQAQQRLARLEAEFLSGRYDGEGQEESYYRLHKALSSRVAKMRTEIADGQQSPEIRLTGQTYADIWAEKDDEQRKVFLKRHEVQISVDPPVEIDGARRIEIRLRNIPKFLETEGIDGGGLLGQAHEMVWEAWAAGKRRRGEGQTSPESLASALARRGVEAASEGRSNVIESPRIPEGIAVRFSSGAVVIGTGPRVTSAEEL